MMNRSKHAAHIASRRTALALAMALGLGLAGSVAAQSTTGRIFGQAAAGETVSVQGTSGTTREVTVDSSGRFDLSALPPGNYTVTLKKDGAVVDTRENVFVVVGSGTEVPFAAVTSLATVSVSANALPAIDISGVDSRTVVTSQQLAALPLVRSAEAVALLAPGVVPGSALFTDANGFSRNLVSFGGSSVVENAYYLNGFNTTDPISGMGGLTLPYGAIDQQEILSGGYGAAYGRSDGGVISQIGKRGTNEWHFGGQLLYTPTALKADPRSYYYVNPDGSRGKIRQDRYDNKSWNTTADAYFGGPLIQNRLYIFGAVEADRVMGQTTGTDLLPIVTHYRTDNPKWYGKLDWNITDNNILEITGASNKSSYSAVQNTYDYATHTEGGFNSYDASTKVGSDLYSAKFTSYVTDNLTFSALYGQMRGTLYSEIPGYDPTNPYLFNPNFENPAITGGNIITNSQTQSRIDDPAHTSKNTNLRLDVSYKLGAHTLTAGIDNQNVRDSHDGQTMSGPGYAWEYGYLMPPSQPTDYIVGGPVANAKEPDWTKLPWVQPPAGYTGGETGYYVAKYVFENSGSVRTTQRAQYIEDSWQVTDRWLVKLGLRNDQFTNYNSDSIPYLRLTSPQWAPRVGFSWDVNGDSSFKVYGNAGRYYLAMPASVALRAAGASLYTREYMTYTGIDANGNPTGLTPIQTSTGGPISANLEYGIPRDPKTATSANLKSEYQDEYILGFDKQLGPAWTYGVKATYRNLRNAIDDIGDAPSIQAKMDAMGIDPTTYDPDSIQGSYLINPGRTSIFEIPKLAGGYYTVPMDWVKDFHFNTTLKRKYYGVNFYLEHPFDGKWFGKVDYLYSRSYGNSEGQVRTDIGQTDVSATVDWDYAAVMDYANGDLANSRRHQIKAYGAYKFASEWMLSGNVFIASGAPRTCLALYGGPEAGGNPGLGYGPYYHFCRDGQPYSPGKQHEPWTYQVNLGAEYRPMWAEQKLAFNVNVFNVFDNQTITQRYPRSDNVNYLRPYGSLTPRSVRFGITYDF